MEEMIMAKSITEVLGIKYPILQGAMAWIADADLVSAVSNAGGAGVIAAGGRSTEWVEQEIKKARELTDKPFGVNVMLMAPNKDEIVEVICREKPAFVTLGAGNPVPFLEKFKSAGVKTVPVVPNVKLAKRWPEILRQGDPYYNPALTLRKSNFVLRDLKKETPGEPFPLPILKDIV